MSCAREICADNRMGSSTPPQHEQQGTSTGVARRRERGYAPREVRAALWYIVIAWIFGAAFCSLTGGAPLYSFLKDSLHTDDFSFGLVMAAGPTALLFFFLGSLVVERTGRVKSQFLLFVTAGRFAWVAVAAIALWMPVRAHTSGHLQVLLVGVAIFLSASMQNFGGAGWPMWMSEVVPTSVAGKFFGIRSQIGLISMVLAALGGSALIDHFKQTPWLFAALFALAAILGCLDILHFMPIRELPRQTVGDPPSPRDILITPWKNPLFRSFACYTTLAWIAYMMMSPFVSRYCLDAPRVRGLGMSVSMMNLLLFIIPWVSMALVSPWWGQAVDRFGPKPVLTLSAFCTALSTVGWCVMQPALRWTLPFLVAFVGFTWPGIDQTSIYMQVKGFPAARNSAYNATFLAVNGFASVVGMSLGGWYASFWAHHMTLLAGLPIWVSHYHPVFLTSLVLRFAAFFFLLPRLQLPGTARMSSVAGTMLRESVSFLPHIVKRVKRKG